MENPRSRVQDLKIEIGKIGQKISVSKLDNFELQTDPLQFDKNREKEALQKQLKSLKSSTTEKKKTFDSALQQILKKLQSLSVKKQNVLKGKNARSKYLSRIQVLEQDLGKVSQDLGIFCEKLSRQQKFNYNSSIANELAFEQCLSPIEVNLNNVASQHMDLLGILDSLQKEIERLTNVREMTKEEIIALDVSKAEMISEREGTEIQIEMMEFDYCDELEYSQQEDEFIQSMLKFKKVIDPVLIQSKEIQNSLEAVEVNLANVNNRISNVDLEFVKMCTGGSGLEEIKGLEEAIAEKAKVFNAETIFDIVADVNASEGFEIEEELVILQLEEVKKFEADLRKRWEFEEKVELEKIKACKSNRKESSEIEKDLKQKRKMHRNHIAVINQWKNHVSKVIEIHDIPSKPVADSIILRDFKSQFSSITYKDHKKLESLISTYLSLLEKREKSYIVMSLLSKKKEKNNLYKDLQKLYLDKPSLLLKQFLVNRELFTLELQEKNMIKSIQEQGINPNPVKAQMYLIKESLLTWDESYAKKSEKIEAQKKSLFECNQTIALMEKEITGIRHSKNNLSNEEYALNAEVEKILEQKKTDMLGSLEDLQKNSKNPEELKLYQLKYKAVEASVRLEKANKELNDFDDKNNEIIQGIEQEEMELLKQQQEITNDLKGLEEEQGFIVEYEEKIRKLDEIEATPLSLDLCRSPVEHFYRNEIRDVDDRSGAIEGPYLEFAEKILGRQGNNGKKIIKKYYRFKLEGTTQAERIFFEKIMPLLEGAELYKRSEKIGKKAPYNPLDDLTPEVCGYCTRYFYLHKQLEKVEMRQPMKPGFDVIRLDQIISPKISKLTMALLHAQGHLASEDLDIESSFPQIANFSKISMQYASRPRDDYCYPFSIALSNKEKIKLIAKNYLTFKQWVNGINALVKNKKRILKLRTRIECYTSV